jgi:hypothetical protein
MAAAPTKRAFVGGTVADATGAAVGSVSTRLARRFRNRSAARRSVAGDGGNVDHGTRLEQTVLTRKE